MNRLLVLYPHDKSVEIVDIETRSIYAMSWDTPVIIFEWRVVGTPGSVAVYRGRMATDFWRGLARLCGNPEVTQVMLELLQEAEESMDPAYREIPEAEVHPQPWQSLKDIRPGALILLADDSIIMKTRLNHDGQLTQMSGGELDENQSAPTMYFDLLTGLFLKPDAVGDNSLGKELSLLINREPLDS